MASDNLVAAYRRLVDEQTRALAAWVAETPARRARWARAYGAERTVPQYMDEYADRFAITACVASDLDHPQADAWMAAFDCFAALEDLMR